MILPVASLSFTNYRTYRDDLIVGFIKELIKDVKVWFIKREFYSHVKDFTDSIESQGYVLTHGTVTVRYSANWINIEKLAKLNSEYKKIQFDFAQKLEALGREA